MIDKIMAFCDGIPCCLKGRASGCRIDVIRRIVIKGKRGKILIASSCLFFLQIYAFYKEGYFLCHIVCIF